MEPTKEEIVKALKRALGSDHSGHCRAILQDILVDLDPPKQPTTLEGRMEKLESMFGELVCGMHNNKSWTVVDRIYKREYRG